MTNSQSVGLLLAAGCVGTYIHPVQARCYSLESSCCLFDLAKPAPRASAILFSFMPLARTLLLHAEREMTTTTNQPDAAEPQSPPEFSARFDQPLSFRSQNADPTDDWPLFSALHRWQSSPEIAGLSHTFRNPHSIVALDYSDIFESGRAAYKGSHGVSLFFLHKF